MSDNDRGTDPLRDPPHDTERTTVVHTESRSGGSGLVIAIVLIIAVLALLFFLFGGSLKNAADEGNINIAIDAPDVTLPNVPDVNLNIPDVDLPKVDVDVDKDEPAENKT